MDAQSPGSRPTPPDVPRDEIARGARVRRRRAAHVDDLSDSDDALTLFSSEQELGIADDRGVADAAPDIESVLDIPVRVAPSDAPLDSLLARQWHPPVVADILSETEFQPALAAASTVAKPGGLQLPRWPRLPAVRPQPLQVAAALVSVAAVAALTFALGRGPSAQLQLDRATSGNAVSGSVAPASSAVALVAERASVEVPAAPAAVPLSASGEISPSADVTPLSAPRQTVVESPRPGRVDPTTAARAVSPGRTPVATTPRVARAEVVPVPVASEAAATPLPIGSDRAINVSSAASPSVVAASSNVSLPADPPPAAVATTGVRLPARAVESPAVAPVVVTDTNAIQTTLGRYLTAFMTLDVDAAKAVWPSVNERALSRAFASLDEQEIEMSACEIAVAGRTADAACTGVVRYVTKVGNRAMRIEPRSWKFALRNSDSQWVIENVQTGIP